MEAKAGVGELAGARRAFPRPREQHRHVGLAPRGVEEARRSDEVDLDLGMRGDETREARRDEAAAESFGHADAKLPRQVRRSLAGVDARDRKRTRLNSSH